MVLGRHLAIVLSPHFLCPGLVSTHPQVGQRSGPTEGGAEVPPAAGAGLGWVTRHRCGTEADCRSSPGRSQQVHGGRGSQPVWEAVMASL